MEEIEIIEIKMKINEKTKSQLTVQHWVEDDTTRCWGVNNCVDAPGEEELEELEIT